MTGGTLIVNRYIKIHDELKEQAEGFGFRDVFCTDCDRDALNEIIYKREPELILMDANFYNRSTPYMMKELLKLFPKQNIAVVNIFEFPDDLAMWFFYYGIKSYVNKLEGREEFIKGMKEIKRGHNYIAPAVIARMNLRNIEPEIYKKITGRMLEVTGLICCGYKEAEISEELHITTKTVEWLKTKVKKILNVRNNVEIALAAFNIGLVNIADCNFYPRGFSTIPDPNLNYLKAI